MVYDLIADPLPEAAKPFGVSKYLDKCMSVLAMSECTNIIKHSHRCHSPSQVRSQSICKSDVPKQYFCTLAAATLLKSTWICLIRGARTLVEDPTVSGSAMHSMTTPAWWQPQDGCTVSETGTNTPNEQRYLIAPVG